MNASRLTNIVCYTISLCLLFQAQVYASSIQLPSDTRVYVETKQDLVAKGDRVQQGQAVRSQVWRDVVVNGHVLIAAGTPVIAKVDQVKNRQIAGVKGSMTIGAYETESVDGQVIQLSGGYHKEGKSRMALSITLGVLFILPILIPGKAAELPAGTVFDAYIDKSWQIKVPDSSSVRKLNLSNFGADISAELLYEKFESEEKPKYFEFQITVPQDASRVFVIDRINSEVIKPLKLKNVSEFIEDDEAVVNAQIKIKSLLKKFAKGINTIEIASVDGDERVAAKLTIDIEI
ncbi:MAG: hypothetical protein HKP21_01915 [Xanthomonadales bacterium]|nr:hypothetical protein [Gammaproteobacteria bacterium]MBT8072441.1 hypothetical protein [Gammaproteobacteria bacterium]NNK03282.1 hypothetical protein [Xanthomonadales bacterium]NNK97453.1 hypothetical protein [Xanthomonadales bacterium]